MVWRVATPFLRPIHNMALPSTADHHQVTTQAALGRFSNASRDQSRQPAGREPACAPALSSLQPPVIRESLVQRTSQTRACRGLSPLPRFRFHAQLRTAGARLACMFYGPSAITKSLIHGGADRGDTQARCLDDALVGRRNRSTCDPCHACRDEHLGGGRAHQD